MTGYDIIVVGAGPAGLAFARSLDGTALRIAIVERQRRELLAAPASDGREIALTHRSVATLQALDAWRRIDPGEIAPLRGARVLNGGSRFALSFDAHAAGEERIGQLVPNHQIRQSLFAAVAAQAGVTFFADSGVVAATTDADGVAVTLDDGRVLGARLLVAADSRFSALRDQLGIAAEINRLGRSMMVCRVAHERDHGGIATECFDHGQTIAMLPLNGGLSSAVLTLSSAAIDRLAALDARELGAELTRRYRARLGAMRLVERPHVYPLATTYARHFAATRATLIGDAAVGMHPVTAHGFNLGLRGAMTLGTLVGEAAARRGDIAAPSLLRRYEAAHRLASRPIHAATNMIVALYTTENPLAHVARHAALRAAARLPLVREGVNRMLTRH